MIIQSTRVYYEEKIVAKQVEIKDDKIINILPYGMKEVDRDYGDALIMPGLIDIHNHGYNTGDCNSATKEWLAEWTSYLPSEGVTSTLATISTAPYDQLIDSLKNIGAFIDSEYKGTNILGVYSEGPFISAEFKGAQALSSKIVPTNEIVDAFDDACNNHLIYVMLAPEELNGDYEVIRHLTKKGIKVTLGHTGATFDIAEKAIENGAISFTHTYNGMRGLHHREPGVVAAAMYHDECYAELICDGVHVHKVPANILAKTKGKDRLILVTDSVAIKGLKPGVYDTGSRVVTVGEDGVGRLENGTLAGSCNKLNKVLQFALENAKIDTVTALNACTINPCKLLAIKDKGLIKEAYDADIAVFDKDFNPIDVYIAGHIYK